MVFSSPIIGQDTRQKTETMILSIGHCFNYIFKSQKEESV